MNALCYCRGDHDDATCRFVLKARLDSGCFDHQPERAEVEFELARLRDRHTNREVAA